MSFQALRLFLVWVIGYSAARLSGPFLKVLRNPDLSCVMMSLWAADKRLLDALIPIPELRFPLISSRLLSVTRVLGTPALSASGGLMTFSLHTSPWRESDPPLRRPGFWILETLNNYPAHHPAGGVVWVMVEAGSEPRARTLDHAVYNAIFIQTETQSDLLQS